MVVDPAIVSVESFSRISIVPCGIVNVAVGFVALVTVMTEFAAA
jgi:hypothetical protein